MKRIFFLLYFNFLYEMYIFFYMCISIFILGLIYHRRIYLCLIFFLLQVEFTSNTHIHCVQPWGIYSEIQLMLERYQLFYIIIFNISTLLNEELSQNLHLCDPAFKQFHTFFHHIWTSLRVFGYYITLLFI